MWKRGKVKVRKKKIKIKKINNKNKTNKNNLCMYWVCIHVPILDHTTKSTLKINLKYYKIQYLYPNIFFKYIL